jgi:hypothetical protein
MSDRKQFGRISVRARCWGLAAVALAWFGCGGRLLRSGAVRVHRAAGAAAFRESLRRDATNAACKGRPSTYIGVMQIDIRPMQACRGAMSVCSGPM